MLDNTISYNADAGLGTLLRIRQFLAKHGTALEVAALFLGGRRWSSRVRQLCVDVGNGRVPRRTCLMELHALLGLLRLECVDDLASNEAAFFASIDPSDARVHELCLLTDRLAQFLDTVAPIKSEADNTT